MKELFNNILNFIKKYKWIIITLVIIILGVGMYFENQKEQEENIVVKTTYNYLEVEEKLNLTKEDGTYKYYSFPEPEEIIKIDIDTLDKDYPDSKEDGVVDTITKISYDDFSFKTYGTIKVQGTSTALWPKKNFNIDLYNNEDREEKINYKIGDSVYSSKWISKADWKDVTQVRNYISYNLWGEMRRTFDKLEVDNSSIRNEHAQGYPFTYPAVVYINKEFYGLSTLLMGHEPENFNVDYDNPKHMYFEFDARYAALDYPATRTWEKFHLDGINEWFKGYHPKVEDFSDEQLKALKDLGKFINKKPSKITKKEYEKYFDKDNMIDLMILKEVIYDWDGFAADMEMVTYDLEKFYILPWDKDNTFGIYRDTQGVREGSEEVLVFDYKEENVRQKPWFKTYKLYKKQYEKRYAYLRDEEILSSKNVNNLISSAYDMIPNHLWTLEESKWTNRIGEGETDRTQIVSWTEKRLNMLDELYNYKK